MDTMPVPAGNGKETETLGSPDIFHFCPGGKSARDGDARYAKEQP
jgi:hypothetical protein